MYLFLSALDRDSRTATPDKTREPLTHRANFALLIGVDRHTGLLSPSSVGQTEWAGVMGGLLSLQNRLPMPEAAMQQIREFIH